MPIVDSHRPDSEELAAFIDDRLPGDERARLESHLADCAACREVLAESLRLLAEEGEETAEVPEDEDAEPELAEVVIHPAWRRTAWRVVPLAAAALLVVALWQPVADFLRPEPATSGELIAGFANPGDVPARLGDEWTKQDWDVFRIDSYVTSLSREQVAFRLGARAVDLRVALRAADETAADDLLEELLLLLRDGVDLSTPLERRYRRIRDLLVGGDDSEVLKLSTDAEDRLEQHLGSLHFSLGRWAEAGRLAALARDRAYFEQRRVRRYARELLRAELDPGVAEQIRRIAKALDSRLDDRSLRILEEAFGEIVRRSGTV